MDRCLWCRGDPLMEEYHDQEWGTPVNQDHEIFERMVLEVFQAGLSWRTILHKRDAFRKAFYQFELQKVAGMGADDINRLLENAEIVRSRKKIEAAVYNAAVCQEIVAGYGSLWEYLQSLADLTQAEVQQEFRKRFKFMGPIVTESFFQTMGRFGPIHEPKCWKSGLEEL